MPHHDEEIGPLGALAALLFAFGLALLTVGALVFVVILAGAGALHCVAG
jgi:hypothetical protein